MRRAIALLTALCATSQLTSARMGGDPNKMSRSQDNMAAKVDFQTFDLDGQVHDLMWCGYNDETILMHTSDGNIYRSRDRGLSWKRLKNLLQKQGNKVVDDNQEIGAVHSMIQSPTDDQLVVFIGTHGINWISEDCGANVKALNSGKRILEFLYHPTQRTWALAASWTSCAEFVNEPCRIFKELYYTKDLGESWNYMTNYVFDFEWGQSIFAKNEGIEIPDERVWVTRDAKAKHHQQFNRKMNWSLSIDLFYSDDFFHKDDHLALEQGNTIIKTPSYMFISCAHSDRKRVMIYSSTFRSGFKNLKRVRLPEEAMLTNTFTLMDTSEQQVFLFLENKGQSSPFGAVYISDEGGRSFSLSLDNVIKGSAVDFERITSLDGTFIANKYSPSMMTQMMSKQANRRFQGKRDDKWADSEMDFEWDESDIISEEARHASHSRMGRKGQMNRKQEEEQDQIFAIAESIPAAEVQENVKTYITHNKGGRWELIKAPEVTLGGKKSTCYIEDGCSLHLEIYSHMGELAPVYSSEKAVGIILGTGNLGAKLTSNDSQKALFLSRDGGLTWRTIRMGVHIYEIGDHGALVVIARKNAPTNFIEFSWDEGESWETLQISEHEIFVDNIIIEPNSISQQFMVYGTYAEHVTGYDEGFYNPEEDIDVQATIEKSNQAFLVYVDFSQLHEPQCKGVDYPGTDGSDYELWTPHDGRFGDSKCFLGMHKTFVRRKQDSKCYNGEEHEAVTRIEPCICNDMDYECDIGYARVDGSTGPCIEQETHFTSEEKKLHIQALQAEQCEEFGYYEVSQGYRKVPGNMCSGGVDLTPYRYQCTAKGWIKSWFTLRGIFSLAVMGAVIYYGWPVIEAILIMLPLPDPSDLKNKAKEAGSKAMEMVGGTKKNNEPVGYQSQFGMPSTMQDDSGEDDDEEDIGKDASSHQKALDYDSDERDESNDAATTDLISLDGKTSKQRKRVPKLKKPGE